MRAARAAGLAALLAITLLVPEVGEPVATASIWALCLVMLMASHTTGVLSLPALYLLVLGAFHLGLAVPVALGLHSGVEHDWLVSPFVRRALALFCTAAVAFTLGAFLLRGSEAEERRTLPPQRQLFWTGFLVAVLGGVILWIGVRQLGLLMASYSTYFERSMSEDVRFFGFGVMLFPIGLLVAAVGASPRQMFLLGALLCAVFGPLFLHGFRGPAIVQGTALVAVWARKDVRVARGLAVLGVLAAVVLIPAIRASRNPDEDAPSGRRSTFDPVALVAETGGSLYPLVITAERVDSRMERLWMGGSYLRALQRVVPNVSSRWTAPSGSRLTPSAWATLHGDFWMFERGGGIGFSGVAEPYLNFGTAGVVLFFSLLGLVVQLWDRWLGRDPFRAAIGAASFGSVLWTVRNDAMELFRVLAIAGGTVLVAWSLGHLASRRQRVRGRPIR